MTAGSPDPRGRTRTYSVRYSDDEPGTLDGAILFVLRVDTDLHARRAAMAYADSVEHERPRLANELRRQCRTHGGCQR